MQGPTMTMSTITPFPRSHSSPNIPDLGNVDYTPSADRPPEELPRSASFTALPVLDKHYESTKNVDPRVSASAELPGGTPTQDHNTTAPLGPSPSKLIQDERPKLERVGRRKSLVARPKSWIQRVKGSPERHPARDAGTTTSWDAPPPVPAIFKTSLDNRTKAVSGSFASFARKSWINSSRSPSPSRNTMNAVEVERKGLGDSSITASPLSTSNKPSDSRNQVAKPSPSKINDTASKPDLRRTSTFQKMKQKPQTVLMNLTNLQSANSSTSSLPRSSMDNKSTPRTSTDKIPPIPKTFSSEKLQNVGIDIPRRRDELWSAFRSLENDYAKFQAKSWSLKTNVVRSSLLPFLKNHASHHSNKNLRPEDLDRRVNILNRWWTALLEVLDGRQNQTVSGVDRPILLEACYAIMIRPEWRLAPSPFAPLVDRTNSRSEHLPISKQKSSGSLNSSASQFMTESVFHNARNLFIQNLLTQMNFVVEKMSLRHAPASLVTFCGKAAAYAFFFVPGIAEMLVRIWKLELHQLRRVMEELGLPRRPNQSEPDDVATAFPSHIQSLSWSSPKAMIQQLKKTPILPVLASKINWYGPWVARWCGRDSDLFFVFIKHFHILNEEFLSAEYSLTTKACAPGFVLVQAQILAVLDATIHRLPPAEPPPITFEDVLSGADASAAALPLPSNNTARPMAENRCIMLLRDFISERPSDFEAARMTFAETFAKMMEASALRTSIFDHNACFVLADFMEESLAIYVKFHHSHGLESDIIDWYFWLNVCKKMLESQNSMSEIRLFAFIYSSWGVITSSDYRKEVMCLEWLLTEDTFGKFFCHWCPMVRAYYMRLLCWRLCRDDGNSSDLDTKIFSTILTRVKSVWAHHTFLKQRAEEAHILPPSTAPCHAAPGRRFLIIRNDTQSPAANLFLGFDGIMAANSDTPSGTTQATSYKRTSSLSVLTKTEMGDLSSSKSTSDSSSSATTSKKRWNIMGKMLPAAFTVTESCPSSSDNTRAPSPTKTRTLEDARRETALARTVRPVMHSKSSSTESDTPTSTMTHRAYSFKFSLEWAQHFEKPTNVAQQSINGNSHPNGDGRVRGGASGVMGLTRSAERRLSPPRLPAPAQAWIGAKVPGISHEVLPRDPGSGEIGAGGTARTERIARAKYSGRALAEWTLIVHECNNFVERRRNEGVPSLKWVEVPTLGVDGFRKFGGGG